MHWLEFNSSGKASYVAFSLMRRVGFTLVASTLSVHLGHVTCPYISTVFLFC
eukprot:m.242836 g.242836  ORF g.242836 m.242836 type:complete len:52 (+) comp40228_c1_seq1:439-594(+)